MNTPESESSIKDTSELKTLNRWLVVLFVIVILWAAFTIMYVDKRTSSLNKTYPIVMVDTNGQTVNKLYTNILISINIPITPQTNVNITNTNYLTFPDVNLSRKINVMDIVTIPYFNTTAIVVEKIKDGYVLLYKDKNDVLQKITLSRAFLE